MMGTDTGGEMRIERLRLGTITQVQNLFAQTGFDIGRRLSATKRNGQEQAEKKKAHAQKLTFKTKPARGFYSFGFG